jgi:hypothetical protein
MYQITQHHILEGTCTAVHTSVNYLSVHDAFVRSFCLFSDAVKEPARVRSSECDKKASKCEDSKNTAEEDAVAYFNVLKTLGWKDRNHRGIKERERESVCVCLCVVEGPVSECPLESPPSRRGVTSSSQNPSSRRREGPISKHVKILKRKNMVTIKSI